jgi:hypothetical protein
LAGVALHFVPKSPRAWGRGKREGKHVGIGDSVLIASLDPDRVGRVAEQRHAAKTPAPRRIAIILGMELRFLSR